MSCDECHFTFVTAHSPNLSVTSPTSQLILQPFRRFTNVIAHSPNLLLLQLRHSSFSNPSFASPTSQALHLIHLASRPCIQYNQHYNYFIFITYNFFWKVGGTLISQVYSALNLLSPISLILEYQYTVQLESFIGGRDRVKT